jgi:hypothetical protein
MDDVVKGKKCWWRTGKYNRGITLRTTSKFYRFALSSMPQYKKEN